MRSCCVKPSASAHYVIRLLVSAPSQLLWLCMHTSSCPAEGVHVGLGKSLPPQDQPEALDWRQSWASSKVTDIHNLHKAAVQ